MPTNGNVKLVSDRRRQFPKVHWSLVGRVLPVRTSGVWIEVEEDVGCVLGPSYDRRLGWEDFKLYLRGTHLCFMYKNLNRFIY